METTAQPPDAQSPSAKLPPKTATRITRIVTEPLTTASGPHPQTEYRVSVTGTAGLSFKARIKIEEFASYLVFQKSLARIYDCDFESREAEQDWVDYIMPLIERGSR